MGGVLTAFIIFVLCPSVILGYNLLSRYLKYRETLMMLEHGITPPQPQLPPMQMLQGAPMYPMPQMPAPPPPPVVVYNNQNGAGRGMMVWGLVLAGIGLGLTFALWPIGFIANSASGGSVNFPLGLGPWMLAGFVPLFVGLALILGYVMMRPLPVSGPNPPTPFPTGEGGDIGAYSRAPFGHIPSMPTDAGAIQPEAPDSPPVSGRAGDGPN